MENANVTDLRNGPRFLILAGDGINCERETALAFELAGGRAEIVHVNDLLEDATMLDAFDGMAIPGGFSFGDELGSGQLLALKIRHGLGDAFRAFVAAQKPVIGICNGFQVLVKLGLLPWPEEERAASLTANEHGAFMDCWSPLRVNADSVCVWTQGIEKSQIELPVRHGEGRLVLKPGREDHIYKRLVENGQIPLTYKTDINGSYAHIAALCDPTGLVLGMMPHPEAFIFNATHREVQDDVFARGDGFALFENIVNHVKNRKSDAAMKTVTQGGA